MSRMCSPSMVMIREQPHLAVHHILLSYSSAVRLYRRKYRDKPHGFVGISVYTFGYIPITDTDEDRIACQKPEILMLVGQRTPRNSSLQDVSRVKYLHGYIGAVLDALRYSMTVTYLHH